MECHDWERGEKTQKNGNLSKQLLSNTLCVQYKCQNAWFGRDAVRKL